MAFYEGFEVEYGTEYEAELSDDNYVNFGGSVYSPESFEVEYGTEYEAEFSTENYTNSQSGVFSPLSFESVYGIDYDSDFTSGNYTSSIESIKAFYPGQEVGYIAVYYLPSDTAFEAILDSEAGIFTLRGNSSMTEIIYPVTPISEINKVLFRLDSEEIRCTNKVASPVNVETDTIRFRVATNYVSTFLNDLHSNKTNQFRLSTPGYTPFGQNSQDNYVRVLSHSRPKREDRGSTQLIDVEFLFMAVYP